MNKTWFNLEYFESKLWKELRAVLQDNCDTRFWAPNYKRLFQAFLETPRSRTKVIMLGDGIVSQPCKMDGLLYSAYGLQYPVECNALFTELKRDLNFNGLPHNADLAPWARQGVLLLNNSLSKTVPTSRNTTIDHHDFWDDLILEVLYECSLMGDIVFVGIGKKAEEYYNQMSIPGLHRCILVDEPSFTNKGPNAFTGSSVFTRINKHLRDAKKATVNWSLPGCNKY